MAKKRKRGRGEGAVFYSEAKAVWVARAVVGVKPDGSPLRKEVTAHTKADVLQKIREAEAEARSGLVAPTMLLGDWFAHWLVNVARPSIEPTTYRKYTSAVRLHILPTFQALPLASLTTGHVEQFFVQLQANGADPGYVRSIAQVLSAAVRHAVRVGLIDRSPTDLVPRPRLEDKEIVAFTPDEVRTVFTAAASHRYDALFRLAFASGLRQGELLGLGPEHLNLDGAFLRVERALARFNGGLHFKAPKTRRSRRTVTLPAFAVEALREHLARRAAEGHAGQPVVFCTRTGRFLHPSVLCRCWVTLLDQAGVPARTFHQIRHTHASQLLASGVSLVEVARRLGDCPETVLKTYAHHMPGDSGAAGKAQDAYG